jgi:hypothetical protein
VKRIFVFMVAALVAAVLLACGVDLILNPRAYSHWQEDYTVSLGSGIGEFAMQPYASFVNAPADWGVHDAHVSVSHVPIGEGITFKAGINIDGSLEWGPDTILIGILDPDNGVFDVTLNQEALDAIEAHLVSPDFTIPVIVNSGASDTFAVFHGEAWFWGTE